LPHADSRHEQDARPLLDFRPVLANRDALLLIIGYAAVIWGCVGLRQWIVVFLTFCAGDHAAVPAQDWIILIVGALISFLGVPACLIGNELSIRYGLRNIAFLVFLLSAIAGGLFGFTAMLPTSSCWDCPSLPDPLCKAIFRTSPRASSPSPSRSTEGQRSGFIPASALVRASLGRFCSASCSTNSAGRRSWPLGR
jgi:hypothetical protein